MLSGQSTRWQQEKLQILMLKGIYIVDKKCLLCDALRVVYYYYYYKY